MDLRELNALLHDGPSSDLIGAISSNSGRSTLLRLLDSELQRRESCFRRIQEYRNLFGPTVHALPPEVLSKIFYFYALDEDYKSLKELRWTRLLLVCRRWRDVAWTTHPLWSFIDLEPLSAWPVHSGYNPELHARRVAIQRERVGSNPLHVWINLADLPGEVAFFRPYQPFYWRPSSLASLSLRGNGVAFEELLSNFLQHDYPLLTHLEIKSYSERLLFIPDAFISRMSCLRHLKLSGAHINLRLVRGLRSLMLGRGVESVLWEVDDILAAVSRNPRLESLRIYLLPTVSTSSDSPHIFHLPELVELGLEGPSATCVQLLRCLGLQAECKISFVASDQIEATVLQPLLSYLQAHCSLSNAPPVMSLALGDGQYNSPSIDMNFCTNDRPSPLLASVRRALEPHIVHILLPAETAERCAQFASAILAHIPVQSARLLDIRHLSHIDPNVLQCILRGLTALSAIICSLGRLSIDSLVSALSSRLGGPAGSPTRIVLDAEYITRRAGRAWPGAASATMELEDLDCVHGHFLGVVQYCAHANEAGKPIDVLELVNDPDLSNPDRRPSYVGDFPRGDLWHHVRVGFVRNGVMCNKSTVLEELREARRRTIAAGELWDPEEFWPYLVDELDDPVALVNLAAE